MGNFIHFLSTFFQEKQPTGVIRDSRDVYEKQKDYLHEERATSSVADVFRNKKIVDSPYFYENQNYTQSCVAHALTLAALIELSSPRLSKMFTYRRRANYPTEGMWPQGAAQDIHTSGSCLYDTLPTTDTEIEANDLMIHKEYNAEAEKFSGLNYFSFKDPTDFEGIANIAQHGKGVAILIYGTEDEWAHLYPKVIGPTPFLTAPIRHCVCVLPNSSFTENGKRYVTVQDSAWFGGFKLRHVSEDFIKARCYGAVYFTKPDTSKIGKPLHWFGLSMSFGDVNTDVAWLQRVLNYEGLIEADCITGNFFGRTLAAVKALQLKYSMEILSPVGLTVPTGRVGTSTLAWLNRNYGTTS